jgi:uncharacterized membrane protein
VTRTIDVSQDLGRPALVIACVLAGLSIVLLIYELVQARRPSRAAVVVAMTGVLGVASLMLAILRPSRVESDGSRVGPRVVVLVDASRSIDLPADKGSTRREVAAKVIQDLAGRGRDVREVLVAFGAGPGTPVSPELVDGGVFKVRPMSHTDLTAALDAITHSSDEHPSSIIVVSDGRFDRPAGGSDKSALGISDLDVPIHTVALTSAIPKDASVRKVAAAGAAVAHQPFSLRVEVGCAGGLACDSIPVVAKELKGGGSEVLAKGTAAMKDGVGVVELPMTLHLAGAHVVEVGIDAPSGDEIPENDRRFISLDVARDRIRVLHVAGRPTYDVRALRMWLKADESVDVVAFFILRTKTDDVGAPASDLALIPFPVDQLFTVHLRSFDAIVLQDFNAAEYGLTKHLPALADYVREGGGLIMVGGPDSFGPGMYADSPLAKVLPVTLSHDQEEHGVDLSFFTPELTPAGRVAPVLQPLRDLIGEEFPDMPGTNVVGPARPGATVLLTHPTLKAGGQPMPVLALGEAGNGRTIALTIDGTHRLLFSNFATQAAGRAHGALWDGLLGWLMRDPRFVSTVIYLPSGCIAGQPTDVVLRPLPGTKGEARLVVTKLGSDKVVFDGKQALDPVTGETTFKVKGFESGGFAARVEIDSGDGTAPAARKDFACEAGGDEWADSRPDPERLRALSLASGGTAVAADDVASIPLDPATLVATRRTVKPIFPAWVWTLFAAAFVGAHWIVRRRAGLV